MKLLIRQRVFSWTDSYDVYDETGKPKYFVKAEWFTLGHQIHVYEKATGREVGSIHQKLFRFLPAFDRLWARSGRNLPSFRPDIPLTIRAGRRKETCSAGIMTCAVEMPRCCIFPRSFLPGATPTP